MKYNIIFFVTGFFIAAFLSASGYSYYYAMTHRSIESKQSTPDDFTRVVRELVIQEVSRQNYKFSDCFVNMGFKDLKRLYVYISHDNSIQNLDEFLRGSDIQDIFKNQFNSYEIVYLYDRNDRPWIEIKDVPYARVYMHFSLYDKSRFTVSSSVKILYMTISYQRNHETYPRGGGAYLVPAVQSKDEMSEWFKQSINEFARYRAAYMTFSCM